MSFVFNRVIRGQNEQALSRKILTTEYTEHTEIRRASFRDFRFFRGSKTSMSLASIRVH